MDIEIDTLNFINMFKKDNLVAPIDSEGRIIISGMGGSGISGMIVSNLYEVEGGKQVVSWNNYGLPNWINSKDYVICISYSGNTAETISAAEKAIEIGCKIDIITTGGKLKEIGIKNKKDITLIEMNHQPRAALPLLLKPLLYKIGFPNLDKQMKEISRIEIPQKKAKMIAKTIEGKIPCIYSNGIMRGVAYRWRCQIEENAKQLAFTHEIPEMNHNEIVGWTLPNNQMSVILIRDNNEEAQIKNRFETTKNVAWNKVEIIECIAEGKTPLARIMSMIILGDLISIELAKLNNVDPTPVEVIESLKKELGRN